LLKIALPKGRLLDATAALLDRAGWGLGGYHARARLYRLQSEIYPDLSAKIFHERDIPIQVAVGNYDLGICGQDWLEELLAKYPDSSLLKVRNLGYGKSALHIVGIGAAALSSEGAVRIASEYPNLAELWALRQRLKRFTTFPLWGGAEVYPPESADLALISGASGESRFAYGLTSLDEVLRYGACLIANRDSWEEKDLSRLLISLEGALTDGDGQLPPAEVSDAPVVSRFGSNGERESDIVRLALPDGHQQGPAAELLARAGIEINDYPSPAGNRRPEIGLAGVAVKVIRPQDMPLQVANGNFDLAVTGADWVRDHLFQFPSSPVTELVNLKFGGVKIVAVVSQEVEVDDIAGLKRLGETSPKPLRVASEYVNIADEYARDNHLGMYRIIPTWGATEAFLPEDADLLIENTQTGRTLKKNNLKIIDTLGESAACLVGRTDASLSPGKRARIESIVAALGKAVGDS
jgi:ATP phosphoribosyltransferase